MNAFGVKYSKFSTGNGQLLFSMKGEIFMN